MAVRLLLLTNQVYPEFQDGSSQLCTSDEQHGGYTSFDWIAVLV